MSENNEGHARMESEARLVDDRLVISLSVRTLAHAARNSEYFFSCANDGYPLQITDEVAFAKSVIRALNLEGEDGSTPVTQMLDWAFMHVCEQGDEGVEESQSQEKS